VVYVLCLSLCMPTLYLCFHKLACLSPKLLSFPSLCKDQMCWIDRRPRNKQQNPKFSSAPRAKQHSGLAGFSPTGLIEDMGNFGHHTNVSQPTLHRKKTTPLCDRKAQHLPMSTRNEQILKKRGKL